MWTKTKHKHPAPQPKPKREPLGDHRYQELVARAAAFFAEAERDVVAERATAIEEIGKLMDEYGITPDDLLD